MLLGNAIQLALKTVGITEARVRYLIATTDCGCDKRKQYLNALDLWARRVLSGRVEKASDYLHSIFGKDPSSNTEGFGIVVASDETDTL